MEKLRTYPYRMWLLIGCLLFSLHTQAQNTGIQAAEYFIDQDPGIGMGTAIPVSPGLDSLVLNGLNVPLQGLSAGYHYLVVRVLDGEAGWSVASSQLFYINPLLSPINPPLPPFTLSEAEYFFNSDPGPGNGTALPFVAGDSTAILRTLLVGGLAPGTHRVGVRFRELSGSWSQAEWANFTVTDTANLTVPQADFSWDTAAALGGQQVAFTNLSSNTTTGTGYEWDINADGVVDYTTPQMSHNFGGPGIYDVLLRVTNPEGNIDTTGIKAMYRFYDGSLLPNAGRLGLLSAVGNPSFVTDRSGSPGSAFSNDTTTSLTYLRSAGDSLGLNGFTVSYWFRGSQHTNSLFLRTPYGDVISGQSNRHYVGSSNVFVDDLGGPRIINGQWNHVVFSWEPATTNGFKAYLNGVRVSQANSHSINNPVLDSLVLGAVNNNQARGSFDDLFVFGRVLDSSEVVNLYNEAITATVVKQVLVGPVPSNEVQLSGPASFCQGDTITLRAPVGTNHLWSTGAFSDSIRVHASGVYTCAYVDVNGNSRVTPAVRVEVAPALQVQLDIRHATNGLANGSVVAQVSGGSTFRYSYQWSTGDSTALIGGLAPGTYQLTVDDGRCPRSFTVVIADSLIQPVVGIVAAEAFFNDDPGVGAGIPLSVQQGRVSMNVANLSVASLGTGFHLLTVRVQDNLGQWSHAGTARFSIVPPVDSTLFEPRGDILYAEYFYDNDPGVGNGTVLAIAAAPQLDAPFNIPTTGLTPGFHNLRIRLRDSNGKWSFTGDQTVFIDVASPPSGPPFRLPMVAAEYFIGSQDPGVGQGVSIFVPSADSFYVGRDLPLDSLPAGTYRLNVRTRDIMGNWSPTRTSLFTVVNTACAPAQPDFQPMVATAAAPVQLQSTSTGTNPATSYGWDIGADGSIEYTGSTATHTFSHPGIYDVRLTLNAGDSCAVAIVKQVVVGPLVNPLITASGPLTFCSGGSVVLTAPAGSGYIWSTADTTASITATESGAYSLTFVDPAGVRRQTNSLLVTVHPSLQAQLLVYPANNGQANGSAGVQLSGGRGYGYTYSWSTGASTPAIAGLLPGSYQVTVSDGFCPETFSFQIIDTNLQLNTGLVAAEYFFDQQDPGVGNGQPLLIPQGQVAQGYVNVPTHGLTPGLHYLHVRVRDALGQWSVEQAHLFTIGDSFPSTPAAPADLVAAEYYFNEDPGPGNGVAIAAFAPTQQLNQPFQLQTTGLLPGVHNLFIRALDANGNWSIATRSQIFIDIPLPPALPDYRIPLVYAEYFLGNQDPGVGNGTPIAVPTDTLLQLQRSIDLSGLLPGAYVLNLRTRDVQGNWSTTRRQPFNIGPANCLVPRPSFSYPLVNAGQAATFVNTSTNIQASSSYSWDFGADGTVDDTTASPTHAFSSPGVHDVKLTISNGANCVVTVVQQVAVGPVLGNQLVLDGPATFCAPGVRTITAPTGSNYIWSTGDTSRSIQASRSGRYEVAYVDAQGNSRSTPAVQLQVNPAMQIQVQVYNATNGNNNGSAGVSVSGGSAFRYSYLWSNGDTVASISGLGAGQYFVQVSDGYCPQTLFFSVTDSIIPAPIGIVAAEYFFDTDPGVGAGTPFPISQGRQAGGFGGVSLAGLNPGLHLLGMRVLEHTGVWSQVKTYQIFISDDDNIVPEPRGLLASAEYFIDADPGPYNGIPLAVPSGQPLYDLPLNIPVGNISPGAHTLSIRVFDTNGKWSIAASASFDNCNPPAKPTAVADMIVCTGDSVQLGILARDSGQVVWTGPNNFYSTDPAPLIPAAALANSGLYLLRIEGDPGCFSIPDTVRVQVDTIPANPGAILGPATVCLGTNIANFTISPVLTARNYNWQLPAGTVILAGNNTNSIAVDVSNWTGTVGTISVTASNGCGSVTSAPVIIRRDSSNVQVSITALSDTAVCAGQTVSLEASAVPAGYTVQWRRNGNVIAGASGQQFVASQSGNYQAEVLNPAGCGNLSNTIAVSISPIPVALVSVRGASSICGTGSVELTAQAVGGATYRWLRDGNSISSATSRVFQATVAGAYQLVVTSAAGCSDTSATIPLSIYPIPVADITPLDTTQFCAGGSTRLQATSGQNYTYQWLLNGLPIQAADQQELLVSNTGSYRVVVTNAGGCFDTSAVQQVIVNPLPMAVITYLGTDSICAGEAAVLQANNFAGATYQWFKDGAPLGNATNASFVASATGSYQVEVTNASNCSMLSSAVDIHVKPAPDASLSLNGPATFCAGDSVTLSAVNATAMAYQWLKDGLAMPAASAAALVVDVSGAYQLVVTGTNGCSDTSAVTQITVHPNPDAALSLSGNQFVCAGSSLTLSIGATATQYTYQWFKDGLPIAGATQSTYAANSPGSYRLVVEQAATGCVDSSEVVVLDFYPQPQASITPAGPTSFCVGGSVDLVAASAIGVNYAWLKDGQLVAGANSSILNVSAEGDYEVIVTNAEGCSDTSAAQFVEVFALPQAAISANGPTSFCAGGVVQLSASPLGATSYQWFRDGNLIQGAQSAQLAASISGFYTVEVTNVNGCVDQASAVTVTVHPLPQAGLTAGGPTSFCAGGSVDLVAAPATGVSYQWLQDGILLTSATAGNFTATAAGDYQVIVTTPEGCADTSAVQTVIVFPQPQAGLTASGATSFCAGGSVDLVAAPATGVSYSWLLDGAPIVGSAFGNFTAIQSGDYQVIVTTPEGCADTSAVQTVIVFPQPQAGLTAGGPTSFCAGGSVDLVASPAAGVSYQWLQDGILLTSATAGNFTATAAGDYQVIVTTPEGCADTSAVQTVTVFPQPQAGLTAGGPTSFCAGGSVDLVASPAAGVSYQWLQDGILLTSATAGNFTATAAGDHQVIVTTPEGCADTSAAITVEVQFCGFIAGTVQYGNVTQTPMTNTTVELRDAQQAIIGTATTDANGAFSFSNTGNGQFSVQLGTNKPWGGVNATDALAIARHFTALQPLTELPLQAANVNLAGGVNATDALLVASRFTGQTNSFAAGDWLFSNPAVVVNNDSLQLDIMALTVGDVNGSYSPDPNLRRNNAVLLAEKGQLLNNEQRFWPIFVDQALEVGALSLVLELPQGVQVTGIQMNEAAGGEQARFKQEGRELRISWFSLQPMQLEADEQLLALALDAWSPSEGSLALGAACELADGWAVPYEQARLHSPASVDPAKLSMSLSNYPNPFSSETTLSFALPEAGTVSLRIRDARGRLVQEIGSSSYEAGLHELQLLTDTWQDGAYQLELIYSTELRSERKSLRLLKQQ